MPDPIKFHLDENVDHAVAFGLRLRGVDVTTSTESSLVASPDESQLAFARKQGRVLVTHDTDFLHPTLAHGPHAGIIYCAMHSRTVGELVRHLTLIHACLGAEEMHNAIEFC